MYKFCLLLFVATALALPMATEKSLDDLLESIFGATVPTTGSPSSSKDNMMADLDKIFGSEPSSSSIKLENGAKTDEECVMNDRRGVCVPYYLCDKDQVDSAGIDSIVGLPCESYLDVCCHKAATDLPKD
ncbi:hypothetical protein ABMA27_012757 [Loxostege sticticalis]|uniref:Uncharacterized protein n=1 Tax=Loxostege sticticalis TaxID=481309 RepID=A0ABR3GZT6_LOXSC